MAATLVELKSRTAPADAANREPRRHRGPAGSARAPTPRVQALQGRRQGARLRGRRAGEEVRRACPWTSRRTWPAWSWRKCRVWDLLAAFDKVMTAIGRVSAAARGPLRRDADRAARGGDPGDPRARRSDHVPRAARRRFRRPAGRAADRRQQGTTVTQATAMPTAVQMRPMRGGATSRRTGCTSSAAFLALLELIRAHRVRAEQEKIFGTIYIFLLVEVPEEEGVRGARGPRGRGVRRTEPGAQARGSPTDIDAVGSPTDIGAAGSPTDIDAAALPDNAVGAVRLPDAANDSAGLPDATDEFRARGCVRTRAGRTRKLRPMWRRTSPRPSA